MRQVEPILEPEFHQIDVPSARYEESVELRQQVLRTPLGLHFTPDDLAEDKKQIHLGAIVNNRLVACAILQKITPELVKLRQFAVAKPFQKLGIGSQLYRFAESRCRDLGFKEISCHARIEAAPFYRKMGFNEYGDRFTEVGLPHCHMKKGLTMPSRAS